MASLEISLDFATCNISLFPLSFPFLSNSSEYRSAGLPQKQSLVMYKSSFYLFKERRFSLSIQPQVLPFILGNQTLQSSEMVKKNV